MNPRDVPDPGPHREGLGGIRHLARQSMLLLTSGAVSYGGAFLLNVLLARSLGQTGFGTWAVAFALARTLSTVGLMGGDWIVLRQGAYYHGVNDLARLRSVVYLAAALGGGLTLALGAGLFVLAPFVAREAFDQASFASTLRLTAILVPIMALGQVMIFGTQAFKSMREFALIRNIGQPLVRLLCAGVAVLVSATYFSAFAGVVVAEALLTVASLYALHRKLPLIGDTEAIDRRELIGFAIPVWGTKLIDVSRAQLLPVLLGSLAGLSASGAFVASQRIAVLPTAIIAAINQVYKPMGSDLYLQQRTPELIQLFKSIGKWSFALGFPLFCYQIAFAPDIMSIFGGSFRAAGPALIVLAVGMLFSFGTGPVATTLIMSGRARLALIDHVIVVVTETGLAALLIPRYGLMGAAIARMVGSIVNNGVRLGQVWVLLGFHPYKLDYWKPAAAGIVATVIARLGLTAAGVQAGVVSAAIAAAVIGVIYLGLVAVLGLDEEDRAALGALLRRRRVAAGTEVESDIAG